MCEIYTPAWLKHRLAPAPKNAPEKPTSYEGFVPKVTKKTEAMI